MMHPASCSDPGCTLSYRDHLVGIHISADATPNRRPVAVRNAKLDSKFSKDASAYKSMRKDGIQPPHVDGSHELMQRANRESDIEPFGEYLFQKHQRSTGVGTG